MNIRDAKRFGGENEHNFELKEFAHKMPEKNAKCAEIRKNLCKN